MPTVRSQMEVLKTVWIWHLKSVEIECLIGNWLVWTLHRQQTDAKRDHSLLPMKSITFKFFFQPSSVEYCAFLNPLGAQFININKSLFWIELF